MNVTGSKIMAKKSKCDSCDKSYDRAFNLRRHKLANHEMARFLCSLCDLSYSRSDSLSSHIQIVHEGRLVKCDQCDHKTRRKTGMKLHLSSLHGHEKLQCDLCDFKSISRHSIWAHKKRIHDGEKYDCNLCDFTTNGSVTRLRYHVKRMHSSMKDFQCDECEYKASVNQILIRHKRRNHDRVKIKCTS